MFIIPVLAIAGVIGSGFFGFFLGAKLTLIGIVSVLVIGIIAIWLIGHKGKCSFDVPGGPELTAVLYCIIVMLFCMTLSGLEANKQYFAPYLMELKKILVK